MVKRNNKMSKSVVILNYGLHLCGVSRALINLANCLVSDGYDVTIRLYSRNFQLSSELDSRVKCTPFIGGKFGKYIPDMVYGKILQIIECLSTAMQYRLIVWKKFDIEIAFNRGKAAELISNSINAQAKKFVFVHTDYMRNTNALAGFADELAAYEAYQRFDAVICVSEQARLSFIERIGDTKNLITKYNIIDDYLVKKKSREIQIGKKNFTVLSVGSICDAKNYFLLIDVAEEMQHRKIPCEFWIVGDGNLKEELLQYIEKKNVKNVILHGMQTNPYPYFEASDLYMCTSKYEGLSTSVIEALMIGRPIIATECVGMRDILGADNEFGRIVEFDEIKLADELVKMIEDKDYYRNYREKAYMRGKHFAKDNTYVEIRKLM